jgi:predicted DNA-binding protein with PD1-like motif
MQWQQLHEVEGLRTFALVLGTGDEASGLMLRFAREQGVSAATLTGVGAFQRVVLGYFEWEGKDYRDIALDEQVEVVSLVGNVARTGSGDPKVHAHVVVADREGTARGGHLRAGVVRPTLEIVLTETPAHLARRHDEETGLALIDLPAAHG